MKSNIYLTASLFGGLLLAGSASGQTAGQDIRRKISALPPTAATTAHKPVPPPQPALQSSAAPLPPAPPEPAAASSAAPLPPALPEPPLRPPMPVR